MKSIISVNHKFMEFSPSQLINIINNHSKYVEGFEISIDYNNKDHIDYLYELAFQCNKHNMHFQVHGNSKASIDEQIEFFNILYNIYDELGYKINVVLHSIPGINKEDSIKKTTNYLNELSNLVDNNKIIISLENLNDVFGEERLHQDDILPIVANNENIYTTYDIGHVIADFGSVTHVDTNLIDLINNVHIHSHDGNYSDGFDHKPIFINDKYWDEVIKGILFLKLNKYDGSIVFEYDLYACPGDNIEEKIESYLESIDYVSERIH